MDQITIKDKGSKSTEEVTAEIKEAQEKINALKALINPAESVNKIESELKIMDNDSIIKAIVPMFKRLPVNYAYEVVKAFIKANPVKTSGNFTVNDVAWRFAVSEKKQYEKKEKKNDKIEFLPEINF